MSNYYDKRSAKVAIMSVLVEKGWKIYGYKADESDMMTDYWSPADWDGVAEKNGFILLVDQYSTHYSGYEVKKYNYNVKGTSADNRKKIEKLYATLNDAASTPNEKEICKRKIEALENKEPNTPTYTVLETYPTFSYANPKSCTWHIEKDGEIIAKGKGLTTVYDCNNRELTKQNAEKFVSKIEKHIKDDTQLEKVITKVVKKVIKPIQVVDRQTIQKGDVLSFDYHGHYWIVLDVYTRKDGKQCATYELLGSEKRGYQRLTSGKRYYDYIPTLEKNVEAGRVKIHTLQEVEEVTEKVSYKKTKRKQKVQEDNLLSSEVSEEVAATQETNTTIETPQQEETPTNENTITVEAENNGITYETGTGTKGNGIEITFTSKPNEEIRNAMKANGFRWGGKKRPSIWWAIESDETLQLAKMLVGEVSQTENNSNNDITDQQTKDQEETVFSYPEIDINDIETYTIDQSLQDREHDSNWIMRSSKRDHTKEIQQLFESYNSKVIQLIGTTDNQYYIYKLKESLQRFKKNYHQAYITYITHKANNPSWVVTGRGNLNASRYNKKMDQQNKKMFYLVELTEQMDNTIKSYKYKIHKDKENKIKQKAANTSVSIEFKTQKKEFTYMGIKENKRVYIAGDYFICKLWNMFRIFNIHNNNEIKTTLRTTDGLEVAKKYVQMLINNQEQRKAV